MAELPELPPAHLAFRGISFEVDVVRTAADGAKETTVKRILDDISGDVVPGESLVIMGPTGSGKTSLLDSLLGRISSGRTAGQVAVNGRPVDKFFKRVASYVQQFDNLNPILTVRESLMYAAQLGLDPAVFRDHGKELVEHALEDLGLKSIEHYRVGGGVFSGISIGQRKRLSIGVEVVTRPSLLFLDEPTTGIDSAASYNVYAKVAALARNGRTIVATIHQPSADMFELFDKMLLLSEGRLVYYGPAAAAEAFYTQLGFPMPEFTNPPEHFMDLINQDFATDFEEGHIDRLIESYGSSDIPEKMTARLAEASYAPIHVDRVFPLTFAAQVWVLWRRAVLSSFRNPLVYWARVGLYFGLGLMLGSLYWDAGGRDDDIRNRTALLFFLAAFMTFMAIAVAPYLIADKHIFVTERRNGWYGVAPYVVVQTMSSAPWLFFTALISVVCVHFMVGLNDSDGERFVVLVLALFLALTVAEAIVALSCVFLDYALASIAVCAAWFGLMMMMSSFFVPRPSIPDPWIWAHWISFSKYTFEAMLVNEFKGAEFPDAVLFPQSGDAFLDGRFDLDSDIRSSWLVVLAVQTLVYRVLQGLALQRFATGSK